jgi:hypothetical protein
VSRTLQAHGVKLSLAGVSLAWAGGLYRRRRSPSRGLASSSPRRRRRAGSVVEDDLGQAPVFPSPASWPSASSRPRPALPRDVEADAARGTGVIVAPPKSSKWPTASSGKSRRPGSGKLSYLTFPDFESDRHPGTASLREAEPAEQADRVLRVRPERQPADSHCKSHSGYLMTECTANSLA